VNELCDKGPCLKQVKSPNLPKLYKNLLEQKSRFGSSDVKNAQLGESKTKAGPSCSLIKGLNGSNVNGF